MRKQRSIKRWGIEWYSKNRLDGESRYIMWEHGKPLLFDTRDEARCYNNKKYGYIRTRRDLKEEPHGWRMPKVVRVIVDIHRVAA